MYNILLKWCLIQLSLPFVQKNSYIFFKIKGSDKAAKQRRYSLYE